MLRFLKGKNQKQSEAPNTPADDTTASSDNQPSKKSWFKRLTGGLTKTRGRLGSGLGTLFLGKKQIDAEILEQLEIQLLSADVGLAATEKMIANLTAQLKRNELKDGPTLQAALQQQMEAILTPCQQELVPENPNGPYVILMIGVNGAGKTTTIGKLANRFGQQDQKVMLAAGDTFRAAAVEQLKVWGNRNEVPVIAQGTGADSASVIYDAMDAAKAKDIDVLIADTAGRLHTQSGLMDELAKVKRVMQKHDEHAPHEVLLVLDATIGQNALQQADQFNQAMNVTGLVITKLDGTAKGGIIFAIADKLEIPIRYIGVGEGIDDLQPFDAHEFTSALLMRDDQT